MTKKRIALKQNQTPTSNADAQIPHAILPAYSNNRSSTATEAHDQARNPLSADVIDTRISLLKKSLQETHEFLEKEKNNIALKEETDSIRFMQRYVIRSNKKL